MYMCKCNNLMWVSLNWYQKVVIMVIDLEIFTNWLQLMIWSYELRLIIMVAVWGKNCEIIHCNFHTPWKTISKGCSGYYDYCYWGKGAGIRSIVSYTYATIHNDENEQQGISIVVLFSYVKGVHSLLICRHMHNIPMEKTFKVEVNPKQSEDGAALERIITSKNLKCS